MATPPNPFVRRAPLGALALASLSDGFFRLDGGAMFGVVPKPLWERRIPADGKNRIRLGLRPLLVRTPAGPLLVDTGLGDKYDARDRAIYAIERPPSLAASLAAEGLAPEDVRFVVNTHLHFDHAGGDTVRGEEGVARPAFPNAVVVVQRREWEEATAPGERSRASYRPDDFLPLEAAGLLRRVDGEAEVAPGVVVVPTPGHTGGHQSVRIESEGRTAVFLGDLAPTTAHVDLPWVMAYDLEPQRTVDAKRALFDAAAAGGWLLVFEHDPDRTFARVARQGGRHLLEEP